MVLRDASDLPGCLHRSLARVEPEKYFIVVINQIGNGLSSWPHNTDGPHAMARFPHVRIGDYVRAQERLLRERFGIEQLELVVGGSMDAQQTYEWAVRFPYKVKRAASIAGTAKNTPHDFIYTKALTRQSPRTPHCVTAGTNPVGHGFLDGVLKARAVEASGFALTDDFQVGFVDAYFQPMNPNDLLCMAWKWQRGNVSRHTGGDLAAALGRIEARTFVTPIDEDMFFRVRDCAAEQKLVPNSELRIVDSVAGHLLGLFGLEEGYIQQIDRHIGELLDQPA